jgi:hypothetical protein
MAGSVERQASRSLGSQGPALSLLIASLLAAAVWLGTRSPGTVVDYFEQGHWLGPASDMLAGKVPYRDTFPVHGLLSDGGLDWLIFRFTRPSFRISSEVHHLLDILFQPCLFLVAAAATRRPWLAALAIPLNFGFAIGLRFERPVASLLGLAAFLWAIDDTRPALPALAAGILTGLSVFWGIEFGLFVLSAEVLTLLLMRAPPRRRSLPIRVLPYLFGLVAVFFPFAIYLAVRGALVPFFGVSFVNLPRFAGRIWGVPFPAPWDLLAAWAAGRSYATAGGSSGIYAIGPGIGKRLYLDPLVAAIGLAAFVLVWRRRGPHPAAFRLFALSMSCGLFFRYVVTRFHFEGGNALSGPLFLLTACVACAVLWPGRRAVRAAAAAITVLGALAMNGPLRAGRVARDAFDAPRRMSACPDCRSLTAGRGDGALVPAADAELLAALREFTDRRVPRGAPILDLANQPALYFFLERVNPTRFYQTPWMAPFEEEVLASLKTNPPRLVILASSTWLDAPDGRTNRSRIPRIWQYVAEHYPRTVRIKGLTLALPAGEP